MKNKLKLITFTMIGIMLFSGCGTTKNATKSEKTYNYNKEYQTAANHFEDCILDDDTYVSLKKDLSTYEDKNLKKLSKKDAKALKSTIKDIEEYYEASAETIQNTLAQIGQVYPTDEGFYDDNFKSTTTALFQEFNTLFEAGHYKKAADKLNEITSSYTSYVESKGTTVSADVTVDANKTASIKVVIASNKNSTKDSANKGTSGSTYTENPVANAGNNGNTNNASTSNNNASSNGTIANTNTTSNANTASTNNKNNTPSSNTGSSNSSGNINNSNHNSNTSTPAPTRIPYSWTCPECGAVITGYKGEDDNVNEHAHMHTDEEANAQLYRSQAQAAYGQAQADALDAGQPWNTNMHDWCLANGWDVDRMNADAIKYGWGTL
ncbi:hypothetical protein H8R94_01700 [Roseburia sp. NSJ-9]|uniref:C2H2-type domain-containing protein n=1 Tax=Roseburia lenta TaxID=2763061 RepID=A0ABR7GD32_9FIRM|nr:hypothetical protein [Roseburia lenta]MBC5685340.1 hypothetical protein [Roseburia lenta]